MTTNTYSRLHLVVCRGILLGALCLVAKVSRAQEPLPPILDAAPSPSPEGVELLTRGPLHEAFATSAPLEPLPGIMVKQEPPADIQELPPTYESVDGSEQEPIWIPGYWSWDDEREDYLWVSGAWRIPPVDRRWVPGYWNETSEGWQWVSGFWAPADAEQLNYLEPPPPTLEAGPSIPAPSENHFWIPGTWIHQSHAYHWRPGYWCPFEEDRVWIPAHYVWTPSGCVHLAGYWDYVLPQRGSLYAPVYFHHAVRYYRPSCRLHLHNLLLHLFVSRHHRSYFFGDYYDAGYRHRGRYPLYQHHLAARHHNPLLTYYDVYYGRRGIDSRARLRGWHNYYSSHAQHRPPHTWSGQVRFTHDKDAHRYHSRTVLASAPKPHGGRVGEAHVDARSQRDRDRHQQFRDISKRRKDVEAKQKIGRLADSDGREKHVKLPTLQDSRRLNDSLRSRDHKRVERQHDVGESRSTLIPAKGPSAAAVHKALRKHVQQRIQKREAPAAPAKSATAQRGPSSLKGRAVNRAPARTETTAKHVIRNPPKSSSPRSGRCGGTTPTASCGATPHATDQAPSERDSITPDGEFDKQYSASDQSRDLPETPITPRR